MRRETDQRTHLGGVQIIFHAGIFSHMLAEIAKHPTEEEGGKYIGYLLHPGQLSIEGIDANIEGYTILITDFLQSGPNAVRTAVEFRPDGEYQERLFRKLETQDPDIEHLGTWHTHHCNGLKTLSQEDVRGYFRTVNKAAYRPKFFLASLVTRIPTDPREADWIDHFLFVKGSDEYHIVSDQVRVLDLAAAANPKARLLVRKKSSTTEVPYRTQASTFKHPWYRTDAGRSVLAEDKRFFALHFGGSVVSVLRGDRIITTGHLGDKTMSVMYPEIEADDTVRVYVRKGGSSIVEITCEVKRKRIGYAAALAALQAVPEHLENSNLSTE